MRTKIIAGNWKMNKTNHQAIDLVKGLHYGLVSPGKTEIIVAPPFTALSLVADFLKDSFIAVAAQNMHWKDNGAFTGEISGAFIKDAGADYVIIGHSERRAYFGETDETVNLKIKAAFRHGLIPIVCVGETLEQREANEVATIITRQVAAGLFELSHHEAAQLILAYEPVWAIGTGKSASPEQASEVHKLIRGIISELFSSKIANNIRILYGGSVKPVNISQFLQIPDIDGALIGGASLDPAAFIQIIKTTDAF